MWQEYQEEFFFNFEKRVKNKAPFREFQDEVFTRPYKTWDILDGNMLKQINVP